MPNLEFSRGQMIRVEPSWGSRAPVCSIPSLPLFTTTSPKTLSTLLHTSCSLVYLSKASSGTHSSITFQQLIPRTFPDAATQHKHGSIDAFDRQDHSQMGPITHYQNLLSYYYDLPTELAPVIAHYKDTAPDAIGEF